MNAKTEFEHLIAQAKEQPLCAVIQFGDPWMGHQPVSRTTLMLGYTPEEFNQFLTAINSEYNCGYGSQELFGTVWFTSSWAERGEYDGSEWWELRSRPSIPDELVKPKLTTGENI